jgi:hypothetical protein
MLTIGIDPGLTGACAVRDHNGLRAVFDLPTMPIPGVGPKAMVQRKVDGRALCTLFLQHCPASEAKPTVVIEAVGTMGGANNAVQTQGSLLRTLGAIETVAECLAWPVEYANAQTWKRLYGLIDSSLKPAARKAKAMDTARRLYPTCTDIARVRDHNRAEAILLAHWHWRVNGALA